MQQIILSGIGGQGVLFLTRLLAETALALEQPILMSETHGMAQRGGNVISHLKIGSGFASPLVRPGHADIFLGLHEDAFLVHGFYLKSGGRAFCNSTASPGTDTIDATRIARGMGSPVSANVVLLGFAAASGTLFCTPDHIEATLKAIGGKRLDLSLRAFHEGLGASGRPSGH